VSIVELETEHASATLLQKLVAAGFNAQVHQTNVHALTVEAEAEQKSNLVETLVDYVFTDWCYDYICLRIAAVYDYLTDDEREYIALLTFHGIRKSDEVIAGLTHDQWRQLVQDAVEHWMDAAGNSPYLNVDGLVRFRVKDYLLATDHSMHEVVEQFLADREYEEFVSMLRYMLDTQPPNEQVLHVYCTNDRVWITDSAGELVRDTAVADAAARASDGDEVNAEDLAMSILITRAPCRIVIHDMSIAAPWPSFSETVEKVFVGRAARCDNCSTCRELLQSTDVYREQNLQRKVIPDKLH
jgi:putative sporulation protein YtxC